MKGGKAMTQSPPPRLRLDFYPTAVLLSRWEEDGRIIAHPISVHDVVSACTNIGLSSGLLPPNTLFWKQQASRPEIGIYVPARRWRVQVDSAGGDEARTYHVPMPPIVFVGSGNAYQIYAVKRRPRDGHERLYHAPCPNVHHHGGICSGNTPFPVCSPHTIASALSLFMENSLFSGDLSRGKCRRFPDDVRQLWAALEGRNRFPLSDLVGCKRALRDLL
jgi:PRTRC genetic system protein B